MQIFDTNLNDSDRNHRGTVCRDHRGELRSRTSTCFFFKLFVRLKTFFISVAHWILAYVTIQMNQLCRLLWNRCGFGYLYSNGRSVRTASWLCKDQFCRGWTETICGMVKSKASVVFVFIRHWKIWVYFFHLFFVFTLFAVSRSPWSFFVLRELQESHWFARSCTSLGHRWPIPLKVWLDNTSYFLH